MRGAGGAGYCADHSRTLAPGPGPHLASCLSSFWPTPSLALVASGWPVPRNSPPSQAGLYLWDMGGLFPDPAFPACPPCACLSFAPVTFTMQPGHTPEGGRKPEHGPGPRFPSSCPARCFFPGEGRASLPEPHSEDTVGRRSQDGVPLGAQHLRGRFVNRAFAGKRWQRWDRAELCHTALPCRRPPTCQSPWLPHLGAGQFWALLPAEGTPLSGRASVPG